MAVKVNSEKTDAQDVTKQYVDLEARIRNLRAQEAQYLEIMRSAKKVQDMLDVSEKLSEVRVSWRAVRRVGRMFSAFSKPAAPTTQPS